VSELLWRFRENAALHPDKPALLIGERVLSYAELERAALSTSAGLLRHGVAPGDHVAVVLGNCPEFVILMLSAAELGLVLVPLSPTLSGSALVRAFQAADVSHVVGWHSVMSDLLPHLPNELSGRAGLLAAVGGCCEGCLPFEPLAQTAGSSAPAAEEGVGRDSPYILTMTSGSTGDPKPIVLTQGTKINRAMAAKELYGVTAEDITLAATPLYHSLAERLVLLPLLTGGTAVVMQRYTAAEWLKVVRREGVSFSIAVSSQLKQILAQMKENGQRIESMRCLVSSSALLEAKLKEDLLEFLSCEFHECYGASEVAIVSNLDPEAARRKTDTVGAAAPGVDIKILGENDEEQAPGAAGEIAARTPMLFGGYYRQPQATAQAMWGEYFRTGDIGSLDCEGFLKFLGRKKEIIITGAINVYPLDVEEVLLGHPGVRECAVIAVPDDRLGEAVAAVIVPKPGAAIDLRELRRLCARSLADFQQPKHLKLVAELPKNPMGKVMKRLLSSEFPSDSAA
jgi:long-chain acyl-CoA synthetase